METKGKKGAWIAVIILAVCIVLGIALCLFFGLGQKTEKMSGNLTSMESTEAEKYQDAEASLVENSIEDFTVKDEQAPVEKKAEATDSLTEDGTEMVNEDYLCAYSASRELTQDDVDELNEGTYENLPEGKSIIRMVINEMYARYGYEFSNEEIQAYFDAKPWYQEITDRSNDMDAIYQSMTDIEKANVDFLTSVEE